jgi:CubicO group peptidase (beta-lactamase class C family)
MKLFKRILFVFFILLIITAVINYPKLNIISGYASKNMASSVFVAHRSAESINENDNNVPLIKLAKVEQQGNEASATVFGLMERKTMCRDGLGCVLINDGYDTLTIVPKPHRSQISSDLVFPYGDKEAKDTLFENVDYEMLAKALDSAFTSPEKQKTRTVLVAYKNHIIAERYADGFNATTPILGWSMTKSVLATLYGILEYNKKIDLTKPVPIVQWNQDERKSIRLDDLLRMQSGLAWDEDYSSISDVTRMLFLENDMSQVQLHKKAIAAPGEIWNYSSGTTNLLSGLLRKQFKTIQDYLDFPYSALIDKIGMHSMLIETDGAGNFVGSSYGWASTRDWAKFGLLYMNQGNWNGEQLFDASWIRYITEPTAHSDGTYGAHFWLNANGKYPDVPKDLYSANGYEGQYVFIIPSKELVIVRTGLAEDPDFELNRFLKEVVHCIRTKD